MVAIAVAMSAVSLYYYLIVLKHVFVFPPRTAAQVVSPGYWRYTLGLIGLAVVFIGLFPQPLVVFLQDLVQSSDLILNATLAVR